MVSMNIEKLGGRTKVQIGGSPSRERGIENLSDGGAVRNRSFSSPKAEEKLFGPGSIQISVPAWTHFPELDDDGEVPARAKRVSLSGREEAALFLKYNYARYRLGRLLDRHVGHGTRLARKEIDLWYRRMMDCKETIARANMALVVAMAKRTRIPNVEFSELVSEGNMALLRSIEKFDVSRGFKFSTYGCRSILKSFNRLATKTGRYRRLFPTEFDPEMERSDHDVFRHETDRRDSLDELREVLMGPRAGLTDLERKILIERFGVGIEADRVRTLAEVGHIVGLTNERVRQIQNTALAKLRAVMVTQDSGI
jgi:RNA polymerase primary sigma factor